MINTKQEHILCAAIWYDDGKVYKHQPNNIFTGYVVCGRRHSNCIIIRAILSGQKTTQEDEQGFLTSKNRFVNRAEAADIAYKAEQIKDTTDCLISEDVW